MILKTHLELALVNGLGMQLNQKEVAELVKILRATDVLKTYCKDAMQISHDALNQGSDTQLYSEWDDVNYLLDLGLQAYCSAIQDGSSL
jgi:hypothetical protein